MDAFTLEDYPYPWEKPAARELLTRLTQLHPSPRSAEMVAGFVGLLASGMIHFDQAPTLVWIGMLNSAVNNGLLRTLVEWQLGELPETSPHWRFFKELLAGGPVTLSSDPRSTTGAPQFIKGSDQIMAPEARLFHDDLTLSIGRIPGLIDTLQKLMGHAPAICKMDVDFNGQPSAGTGFRIGQDLLLTNWHVLHHPNTGAVATRVDADFLFEEDATGLRLEFITIPCDVNTIVTNQADDWAIIRTTKPLHDEWPILKLSGITADPQDQEATYIIQHPGGGRKRMGFVRNQISFIDERVVHYLTDTESGSSGSPVFNAGGRLIALHHAGGRPQDTVGKPPLTKNEGIRISRVVAGLQAAGVPVP